MREILITLILTIGMYSNAQVGVNTEEPKAVLDIENEFLGVQLPRLTTQQINKIKNPEEGLFVYNITEKCLCINQGKEQPDWKCLVMYLPEEQ